MTTQVQATVKYLQEQGFGRPALAIILGSGLGGLADQLTGAAHAPYEQIPGFAPSTVAGHAGRLVFGYIESLPVVAMQGRFHYYEGHSQQQIAFAVRTMHALGASKLIVTNAAGGLNPGFSVGDLMLIRDHINYTGGNPLLGLNDDSLGPRFPDLSHAYDQKMRSQANDVASRLGIPLQQGVYLAVSGPSYETPAEIKTFARLGADAVGMSTVPEVIAAVHCGMQVLGISCITNMAAGLGAEKLAHDEVIEVTVRVRDQFQNLVMELIKSEEW
ncbi:MAG: purine-nucleoside phosphorylase [Firmicutes bacterium]|nr:purine-nucleoside phosphorylase [Bacillota bacterium]